MMLSFKKFVTAIQDAIVGASDSLMDKNEDLLDKYFTETFDYKDNKDKLVPKTVIVQYPHVDADGNVDNVDVSVPLITLVPLTLSRLEKAILKADFEMEVENGELQLHFSHKSGMFDRKPKGSVGSIEIIFSPQETPEGFKLMVEGYEDILKRQIS